MKCIYKGHEIEVSRDKCLGGWSMLYFSIYDSDGFECLVDFEDSEETVRDKMKELKERVDDELNEENPWDKDVDYD